MSMQRWLISGVAVFGSGLWAEPTTPGSYFERATKPSMQQNGPKTKSLNSATKPAIPGRSGTRVEVVVSPKKNTQVSVISELVGNVRNYIENEAGSNVIQNDSHHYESNVNIVLSEPTYADDVLAGSPVPVAGDNSSLVTEVKSWEAERKKWQSFYHEQYPIAVSLDSIAPCGIATETNPGLNEKGGYSGVLLEFDDGAHYVHHLFRQELPVMLDHTEWIDPKTGKLWALPASLDVTRKQPMLPRLKLTAKNGAMAFRLYYDEANHSVGNTKAWSRTRGASIEATRNARFPEDQEDPYAYDFFTSQQTLAEHKLNGEPINDLDATSIFATQYHREIKRYDGKKQRLTLSVAALMQGHALQALKVEFPVAAYHRYAHLPLRYLRLLGGAIKALHPTDYTALGPALTTAELKSIDRKTPLLTTYHTQTLCLKSATFNPALADQAYKN